MCTSAVNPLPMKPFHSLIMAIAIASCEKAPADVGNDDSPVFKEPVPEIMSFAEASLSYYGDDSFSGVSDLWILELDGCSLAGGDTYRVAVSLNTMTEESGEPVLDCLSGKYYMGSYTGDMSAGTFNSGYMDDVDTPDGEVQRPAGSYFDRVLDGVSVPDLLREGYCSISFGEDGTMSVDGMMVGTEYRKRYFTYKGDPEVSDKTGWTGSGIPNTNITGDVELTSLTQTRLVDKGDSYLLGDQSYRLFEFYLADSGIDLSSQWPSGSGELLRIELFVPWETDPEDGIPAGIYSVPENVPVSGGLYRGDIVPYRIVPGYPDRFTGNTGTWYQRLENGRWSDYARITGGTVTVERPDGKYRITVDLTDCGEPSHHVRSIWTD